MLMKTATIKIAAGISLLLFLSGCGIFIKKKAPAPAESSPEEIAALAENYVTNGIELFKNENFTGAIAQWKKALEYIPEDEEVHNYLGIAYHRVGKLDSSIQEYQAAIKLRPDYYQAWNNLGYIYFLKGEYSKALPNFQKALQINPNYEQAKLNYQKCKEIMTGKLPLKAFELVERGMKLDSLELQIRNFRRALKLDSNYADAWNNLGVAYYYYGNMDSAAFCLQKAYKINPQLPEVLNNIAFLLDLNGDYDAAIYYYQKAIQINPQYVIAVANLGDTYYHKKDLQAAKEMWELALRLSPEDPWIQRKLSKLNQESESKN